MFNFAFERRAAVPATLSSLSVAVSLCFAPAAFAQSTTATTTAAVASTAASDPIVVTGTRVPARVSDVIADVSVIDRAQLDRTAGRTLVEVLAQQAGIQFSSNGGLGKSSSLFIRGLEARHTLLLVDGVRIQSATLGTPSLDNLPLEAIDHIEIVRGPMSSLYGNGAVGGVIQVFTRKGTQGVQGNAKVTAGTNRYGQASGGVGFGNGQFDVAAQVQHTETQGFSATNSNVPFGSYNPDRDGFRQNGGSLRVGWQPVQDWRIELLTLQAKGTTGLDDGPGASAQAELSNALVSLSASGKVLSNWRTKLVAADSSDGYNTLSSASAFASLGKIKTKQRQFSWENTVETAIGSVLALADQTEEKVSRPGQPFDVSERTVNGLALGLDGAAGAHVWQASVRHDHNSQFGSADTGSAAYAFVISPAWRVGASYGTSYVAPSFNQLYFPNFGNPLLVPEKGKHGEVSLRWTSGDHNVRAAYYDNRYRGFITSGPGTPVNLPKAKIDGVSLAYDGHWRNLDLTASYDHTDPRNITNASTSYDKQLPRRAKEMARVGADWKGGAWTAGATLAGFSHRFDNAANTARLAGYSTVDLRAEWLLTRELALGVKLNNVADKHYETALGYNQPGRESFVTLRYSLR